MASIVSCMSWVRRGVAKSVPDRLKLGEKELQQAIAELKDEGHDCDAETAYEPGVTTKRKLTDDVDEAPDSQDDDPYNLATYDDDSGDDILGATVAGMTVFASNSEDPYVTIPDEDEDDDDKDDFEIKATDNLIAVGRAAPECSLLEIYVYNEEDSSLYCHHDIIIPAFPLSTAWLNYDCETKQPGNLIALGSMEPVISIWDLDLVDTIEPVVKLGSKQKSVKSKKKNKKKASAATVTGHTDAVLALDWHSLAPTALASASADYTAAVWDLNERKQLLVLKHSEKVQTLSWHPKESSILLTGAFDKMTRLFDCRQKDSSCLKWRLTGEVEHVCWDQFHPYNYFASTDTGEIVYIDSRKQTSTVFTLKAHDSAVSGMTQCSCYKNCLATVSTDGSLKVWDVQANRPSCVYEKAFDNRGGLTCVSTCPDSSSVLAIGSEKTFTVYDINESSSVRKHFQNGVDTSPIDKLGEMVLAAEESDDEINEYLSFKPTATGKVPKKKRKSNN